MRAQDSSLLLGDSNGDGLIDVGDAIAILLAAAGGELGCEAAADVDLDGTVDVSDAVDLLNHLFRGQPRAPFFSVGSCLRRSHSKLACREPSGCPRLEGLEFDALDVVFVVDSSGSLSGDEAVRWWREQILCRVLEMDPDQRFAVVDPGPAEPERFPAFGLAPASVANKAALTGWLDSFEALHAHCVSVAFDIAARIANEADAPIEIVYFGSGTGHCNGARPERVHDAALGAIRESPGAIRAIHAVWVPVPREPAYRAFLRAITEESGGGFVEVHRKWPPRREARALAGGERPR